MPFRQLKSFLKILIGVQYEKQKPVLDSFVKDRTVPAVPPCLAEAHSRKTEFSRFLTRIPRLRLPESGSPSPQSPTRFHRHYRLPPARLAENRYGNATCSSTV